MEAVPVKTPQEFLSYQHYKTALRRIEQRTKVFFLAFKEVSFTAKMCAYYFSRTRKIYQ
jgi:hypothetical protein